MTHEWIKFNVNLERVGYALWIQLGQVKAMCEIISGIPLYPEVQEHLHRVYLAKGVHATIAIEGNTLSEEQVQRRISGDLVLPTSQEYLGIEADNIIFGCNEIKKNPSNIIEYESILKYNEIVLRNLSIAHGESGKIRQHSVAVGNYQGAPHYECAKLLREMCTWLNGEEFRSSVVFGIIRAIIAHIYIAWIHPFADGNGRTARLLEFNILLSHGLPSSTAHLLSNHYNKTRAEYYRQLDYTSKSGGDIVPFIQYAVTGLIDGLKEQFDVIRVEQFRITWRNFIYDKFKNKPGAVNDRKRKLILDMPQTTVAFNEIRHTSIRVAEMYAKHTDLCIKRDLKALQQMGLLNLEHGKYSPNIRQMLYDRS